MAIAQFDFVLRPLRPVQRCEAEILLHPRARRYTVHLLGIAAESGRYILSRRPLVYSRLSVMCASDSACYGCENQSPPPRAPRRRHSSARFPLCVFGASSASLLPSLLLLLLLGVIFFVNVAVVVAPPLCLPARPLLLLPLLYPSRALPALAPATGHTRSLSMIAVQHEAIPQALLGMDVLCQAKSGMGKTAVFVLATLNQLVPKEGEVSVLVLCHTRELAYQIGNEYNRVAKYMPGVKCVSKAAPTSLPCVFTSSPPPPLSLSNA